jgi:diguanylate cyclase (GGDEF)-like protein
MIDPLTGIANRRAFLHDAALLAKRHSGNPRPTAVLLIDLDHFKSINDRFGHALGDRVLEIFSDAARQSVRVSDLIGRLGGEEFAAVLYDTSRDKAVAVAERMRETFARMAQEVDGRPVCATVSVGIVHCEEAALDVPELLAQADQALYFAKESGRNRVEIASLEMILDRQGNEHATSAPLDRASSAALPPHSQLRR